MHRSIVPGLLVLLFFSRAQAESRLRIGVSAGTVNLVSPERLPVAMSNYAERRATVVWFLSARYPTTAAAADSIVSLNQQYRHRRILFVGVFPDPAETRTEVHAFCQGHGFNFPVYLDLEITDRANRIWLVWGRMDGTQPMLRGTGWDQCRLFYRTSGDNGIVWTKDQPFYHDTLGWLPRNLTLFLSDGTLVLPLSDELNGHGADLSFFLSTKDNGSTGKRSGTMRGGEQPTFFERSDGTLVAFLRTRPNILESESQNGGNTWSEPHPTRFKNPDAGISARRLKNGHVILCSTIKTIPEHRFTSLFRQTKAVRGAIRYAWRRTPVSIPTLPSCKPPMAEFISFIRFDVTPSSTCR
jgi:hypothetical protein